MASKDPLSLFISDCLLLAFLINLVFFYSPTVFSFSIYRM